MGRKEDERSTKGARPGRDFSRFRDKMHVSVKGKGREG